MNILFVCTGNTCRSPMAEWILRDLAEKKELDIEVKSAGIFTMEGSKMADNAEEALKELDIEVENSSSSSVDEELLEWADKVLTMSKGHKDNIIYLYPEQEDKIYLLNEYSYGVEDDIEDPFGGNLDRYRSARDEIYDAINNFLKTKGEFK